MIGRQRSNILLYLFLTMMICNSCILPIYTSDSAKNKGWIDVSKIKPGTTTKQDFFLEFGNTFKIVSDDEKIFTSTFAKRGDFYLVIAIPPMGYGGGFFYSSQRKDIDVYQIQIEFDDNDVVKRCDIFKR
jgi:hypothetical protein